MSSTPHDTDMVDLLKVPSVAIAESLASMLESEGIKTYVAGRHLQDEWAMAMKALGNVGKTIQVARRDLEAAQRILDEARAAGDALSESEVPPGSPGE